MTSPVLMWLQAVDLLFDRIASGDPSLLWRTVCVSGAGQVRA